MPAYTLTPMRGPRTRPLTTALGSARLFTTITTTRPPPTSLRRLRRGARLPHSYRLS